MRMITEHVGSPLNDQLIVSVLDEQGPGGAHHVYEIGGFEGGPLKIRFQKGGIAEVGMNGVSNEALLAIVADRLRAFQRGAFGSQANQAAIEDIEYALSALHSRTADRVRRGVEGQQIL